MTTSVVQREWPSKAAFQAHMESIPRAITIGKSAEAPRSFYSFSVSIDGEMTEVGVASSGLGSKPEVCRVGERLLVGHDCSLTSIDVQTLSVSATTPINGVFFTFLPLPAREAVIVIHELGALCVDAATSIRWTVDTDIVQGFRVSTRALVLDIMDSERLVISLQDGTRVL